ncbi:hypothetical protein LTR56_015770 [Elasticomyces elasticus]|nr:hypothetical protein LTR56_015770 [Elasticomyces elasticus]KAK3661981.1 hypothetical protein LTR22_007152 [Elasticomyces elasticus]KAK4933148.1 hypothetical protein LTR49_000632 [Elasticomyces elasticus]KAK5755891.1 hypothetical protein LTS12_014008 [Elasticomyces elasticus]
MSPPTLSFRALHAVHPARDFAPTQRDGFADSADTHDRDERAGEQYGETGGRWEAEADRQYARGAVGRSQQGYPWQKSRRYDGAQDGQSRYATQTAEQRHDAKRQDIHDREQESQYAQPGHAASLHQSYDQPEVYDYESSQRGLMQHHHIANQLPSKFNASAAVFTPVNASTLPVQAHQPTQSVAEASCWRRARVDNKHRYSQHNEPTFSSTSLNPGTAPESPPPPPPPGTPPGTPPPGLVSGLYTDIQELVLAQQDLGLKPRRKKT